MTKASVLLLSAAMLASASAVARADDFAPGADHDLVAKSCTQCHDAATVTAKHMNASQWSSTVKQMIGNGAKISDEELPKIVNYLATNYGNGAAAAAGGGGKSSNLIARAHSNPMLLPQYPPITWRREEGKPIDTRWPEKQDDAPDFPGQTHAPYHASVPYQVTTITDKLVRPWAVAFLPDGKMLITQRLGTMVIVDAQGNISQPLSNVPRLSDTGTQAGLLDVALDPHFAQNHRIFFVYDRPVAPKGVSSPPDGDQDTMSVSSAILDEADLALSDVKVIFSAKPAVSDNLYLSKQGSRIAFAKDGTMFLPIGDRDSIELQPPPWMVAQHLNNTLGKIIHITVDGKPAPGNPFIGRKGALPEIWAIGTRSQEGIAFDNKGQLWEVEDGPRGGDELNLIKKGANYGWPIVIHGIDYPGFVIGDGITHQDGMEDPRYYWDPTIAPSGMVFYYGNLFPQWKGSLFVSTLRGKMLDHITLSADNKVLSEEPLLTELDQRIRDVRVGPDGALYVLTDGSSLLKLTPK
ncbi:MAG: PQQ-dependent sugar dehydrogenase [Pseudomonadota bacterium]